MKKNILITGRPRVGKTSLIRHLANLLGDRAGGFYTEEIKGEGVRGRRGFKIITLDGHEGILAKVGFKSHYNVGLYGVNVSDLDEIGVKAIVDALEEKEWIIIDEIGKMEEFSPRFREALTHALDSPKRVAATIRSKDSPFTADIKARTDVEIVKLTVPDREKIYEDLSKTITTA